MPPCFRSVRLAVTGLTIRPGTHRDSVSTRRNSCETTPVEAQPGFAGTKALNAVHHTAAAGNIDETTPTCSSRSNASDAPWPGLLKAAYAPHKPAWPGAPGLRLEKPGWLQLDLESCYGFVLIRICTGCRS